MTVMHEQVHEWACEKDQIGQSAQGMSGVFSYEIKPSGQKKADQNEPASRANSIRATFLACRLVIDLVSAATVHVGSSMPNLRI